MEYLLKASVLIILLYIGYSVFLKRETFFKYNRWFLLLGLATALVLPLIVIPIYIDARPITIIENPINYSLFEAETSATEAPFDWTKLLNYIYVAGFLVFFTQFLFQFGSLAILLLKNAKNKDGIYTYVIVENKISPFSFFKWIVFNPKLFSDDELQLVLKHEKVHVRQLHSADIILSRLICVAFWFNPIVWLYHKDIQQNLEYIADHDTQSASVSNKDYQHLLLKTSVGENNISLSSNFYNSLIKKRIVMLQKQKSKSVNRWKSALVLPFFILFLMSFNTEEIYIETEPKENILPSKASIESERFEIIFTNKTTAGSFEKFKAQLKERNVIMNIKTLKRNSKGVITKITIDFIMDSGSTKYSVMDDDGISNFYFRLDNENKMSVGSINEEFIEIIEKPQIIEEIIEIEEVPEEIVEIIEVVEEQDNSENKKRKTFVINQNGNETKITGDTIRIIKGKSYRYLSTDSLTISKPIKTKISINGNAKIISK